MFDVITFGSASWDIFLKPKNFQIIKDKRFITGKGLAFNIGSKVDVKEAFFASGGGGTNTAVTFAKQGLKVAYCATVGKDIAGREIVEELKRYGIDTKMVFLTDEKPTNYSIVLNSGPKEDRTILVYRGASECLKSSQIPWEKLKNTKWIYLAPLSGKLAKLTKKLVDFAFKNKIKIAGNFGNSQLSLPKKIINDILKKINVLILNREEASLLTKTPFEKEKEIFSKIDKLCPNIAVLTRGKEGVIVSDGEYIYKAPSQKVKVADATGAGDAFSAGFVSKLILGGDIESAIQFGIANASSCLKEWGAKNGLLKKGQRFKKVKVTKIKI